MKYFWKLKASPCLNFPSLSVVTHAIFINIFFAISFLYYLCSLHYQKELVLKVCKYDLIMFWRMFVRIQKKSLTPLQFVLVEFLHRSNIFFWICTKSLPLNFAVHYDCASWIFIIWIHTSTNWNKMFSFHNTYAMQSAKKVVYVFIFSCHSC